MRWPPVGGATTVHVIGRALVRRRGGRARRSGPTWPRFSACADCQATGRVDGRAVPGLPGPRRATGRRDRGGDRSGRRRLRDCRCGCRARATPGRSVARAAIWSSARGCTSIRSSRARATRVHCEVPISVWEALRGARIRIPTPLDETVLVVPPGTSAGQVFRLRGQGAAAAGRWHAGRSLRHRARRGSARARCADRRAGAGARATGAGPDAGRPRAVPGRSVVTDRTQARST